MKQAYLSCAILALALSACSTGGSKNTEAMKNIEKEKPMVGSDRDSHGCIPSAGYQWCKKTNQCERSWELAKKEGFNVKEFENFCK